MTGDAYRFTMQPVTTSIKRRFRCHVRHSSPAVLYRLFYYVQVPSSREWTTTSSVRYRTAQIHRTVASRAGDLRYSQRGRYDVDFLTAEHNTGLELRDDFVLTAVRVSGSDDRERWNYSVRASTVGTPAASQTSSVHAVSENIFVATVQPQRPFAYRFECIGWPELSSRPVANSLVQDDRALDSPVRFVLFANGLLVIGLLSCCPRSSSERSNIRQECRIS